MDNGLIIKVCGMRDSANIREVEALGIDMMGFIFHPRSPRYVDSLPEYLPKDCRRVGVFVNAEIDEIVRKVDEFGLDVVQLHGNESPDFCMELRKFSNINIIKALSLDRDALSYDSVADFLLFDTPCAEFGGSGRRFDWSQLNRYQGKTPFLLSGGIGPESVEAILALRHPHLAGIDLNSRFELSPGLKNTIALRDFLETINNKKICHE